MDSKKTMQRPAYCLVLGKASSSRPWKSFFSRILASADYLSCRHLSMKLFLEKRLFRLRRQLLTYMSCACLKYLIGTTEIYAAHDFDIS